MQASHKFLSHGTFWVHQAKGVKRDKEMIRYTINTLLNVNMEVCGSTEDRPPNLKQRNEGKLPVISDVSAKILRMHKN